jgi:hypothetical protein
VQSLASLVFRLESKKRVTNMPSVFLALTGLRLLAAALVDSKKIWQGVYSCHF